MVEMCLLLGLKGIKQEKLGQIPVHKKFIILEANRHANRVNTATSDDQALLSLVRDRSEEGLGQLEHEGFLQE